MKVFAKKPSSRDIFNRSSVRAKKPSVSSRTHVPISSTSSMVLQRKPVCPCDGGCPRCVGVIQPKLTIGQPNDKYEQEADRIADQVMRMPEPRVQRQVEEKEEEPIQAKGLATQITPLVQRQVEPEEEEEKKEEKGILQSKEIRNHTPKVTPDIRSRINVLRGGGQSLPKAESKP